MGSIGSGLIALFMLIVRIIVQTYTYITLPIYKLVQCPSKKLKLSRVIRSKQLDPSDPYSPYIRTGSVPHHVLTSCRNLPECFELMKQLYPPDRPVIGYRTILDEEYVLDAKGEPLKMDGRVLRKLRLSSYKWLTYAQVFEKSKYIARGLSVNGFVKHNKCVVFCDTCPENLLFTIATQIIGVLSVGVFSNLGDEGIAHAINETQSEHIFTSYDLVPKVLNLLSVCPSIKTIVFIESTIQSKPGVVNNNNNNHKVPENVRVIPLSQIEMDGSKASGEEILDSFVNDDVIDLVNLKMR